MSRDVTVQAVRHRRWASAVVAVAIAAAAVPASADVEQREPNYATFPVGAVVSSSKRVMSGLVPSGPGVAVKGLHTPKLTLEITGPGEITVLGADGGSEKWRVMQNHSVSLPEDVIIGPTGERIWSAPIRLNRNSSPG